ncbi:MAG: hypothetical protein QM673_07015 [Gordonia sp. (in: high G+C Gram-positive bacteria)]
MDLSVLPLAAATATIVAALFAGGRAITTIWNRTVGGRRLQSACLNQLACGTSSRFVDQLLGTPKFLGHRDTREERLYRLAGAWVATELIDDAVMAFTITVTDPKMHFSTSKITFGNINIDLGRDKFNVLPAQTIQMRSGQRAWVGARRYGYLQHYYFGNPGSYQDYWLSFNQCGAGNWNSTIGSVNFSDGNYGDNGECDNSVLALTINSLTVLGPQRPADTDNQFNRRDVLGPDEDTVRLDIAFRRGNISVPRLTAIRSTLNRLAKR